jgi:hypothetical protein
MTLYNVFKWADFYKAIKIKVIIIYNKSILLNEVILFLIIYRIKDSITLLIIILIIYF